MAKRCSEYLPFNPDDNSLSSHFPDEEAETTEILSSLLKLEDLVIGAMTEFEPKCSHSGGEALDGKRDKVT